MTHILDAYADIVGADVIRHLRQLAEPLQGKVAYPLFIQSTEKSPGNGDHREKLCARKFPANPPAARTFNADVRVAVWLC